MSESSVRKYLLQDLTLYETRSYLDYINGDMSATEWIEKVSDRRDTLLLLQLKCKKSLEDRECGCYIHINEKGECECSKGHDCYDEILNAITFLENL